MKANSKSLSEHIQDLLNSPEMAGVDRDTVDDILMKYCDDWDAAHYPQDARAAA